MRQESTDKKDKSNNSPYHWYFFCRPEKKQPSFLLDLTHGIVKSLLFDTVGIENLHRLTNDNNITETARFRVSVISNKLRRH